MRLALIEAGHACTVAACSAAAAMARRDCRPARQSRQPVAIGPHFGSDGGQEDWWPRQESNLRLGLIPATSKANTTRPAWSGVLILATCGDGGERGSPQPTRSVTAWA